MKWDYRVKEIDLVAIPDCGLASGLMSVAKIYSYWATQAGWHQ